MPVSDSYLILSAFLLALGSVLAKFLLSLGGPLPNMIDPLPFLALQLLGGIVFLSTTRKALGWLSVPRQQLKRPVIAGVILGGGSVGTIMALALISASEASVVFATQPVVMLGLAWILLGERFGVSVVILGLTAVFGVVIIVFGGTVSATADRWMGLAFAAISTCSAALYTVWMRGLSGKLDYLTALIVVQVAAFVVVLMVLAVAAIVAEESSQAGSMFFATSAFGTGVIYYGMAFYIYLMGLQNTEASKAGIYLSLVPVFTILLARIMLAENFAPLQWLGVFVVVVAVGCISVLSGRASGSVAVKTSNEQ